MGSKLFTWLLCLVCVAIAVSSSQPTSTDLDDAATNSLATSNGNIYDDNYDDEEEGDEIDDAKKDVETTKRATLSFVKELKNVTKEAGDFLKLRCEVTGSIPATSIQVTWLKTRIKSDFLWLYYKQINYFFV